MMVRSCASTAAAEDFLVPNASAAAAAAFTTAVILTGGALFAALPAPDIPVVRTGAMVALRRPRE